MHNIQRKILGKLLYAEYLGYAEMRPAGVESNHYAYYLEQLVKAGLIAKQDRKYFLAPAGLALVDRMSQEKMVDRPQPHILTVIDITNDKGQTLLYKRGFQPYIHTLSFPLGKTHMDESVMQAATRELQEKTALTNVPLTHRGDVYVTIHQEEHLISKELCHVFSATVTGSPALPSPTQRGTCLWADIGAYQPNEFMPGFLAIKKMLASESGFFFAEVAEVIPRAVI